MINIDSIVHWIQSIHEPYSYLLVFGILLLCGFGLPIPEDITLIAAGLMAYYGKANVFVMIGVGLVGVMLGDGAMFQIGKRVGYRVFEWKWMAKIMHADRLESVKDKLQNHGYKVIFSARFMPGVRSLVFLSSGALGIPFRVFLFFDGLAALISVPSIVYSCYFFGDQINKAVNVIKSVEHGIIAVIGIALVYFLVKFFLKKIREKRTTPA
ncbi:MAG: DedA family protein [Spirochaetes bacterium]|nr:DedA family protein [Spirochaetota bacterium]